MCSFNANFVSYLDEIYTYLLQTFTTPLSFDEMIEMRGNNPILALNKAKCVVLMLV